MFSNNLIGNIFLSLNFSFLDNIKDDDFYNLTSEKIFIIFDKNITLLSLFLPVFVKEQNTLKENYQKENLNINNSNNQNQNPENYDITQMEIIFSDEQSESTRLETSLDNINEVGDPMNISQNSTNSSDETLDDLQTNLVENDSMAEEAVHKVPGVISCFYLILLNEYIIGYFQI